MPPSSDEFAAWLKVEVWISLAILTLAGVVFVAKILGHAISTQLGGVDAAIPYIVGGWLLVVVGSVWYVGRLDSE